jgi:hypothetical protein
MLPLPDGRLNLMNKYPVIVNHWVSWYRWISLVLTSRAGRQNSKIVLLLLNFGDIDQKINHLTARKWFLERKFHLAKEEKGPKNSFHVFLGGICAKF